jgi:hypothetical protein
MAELPSEGADVDSGVFAGEHKQTQRNHKAEQRKAEQQEGAAGREMERDGASAEHALGRMLRAKREEREAEDKLHDEVVPAQDITQQN